MESNREELYYEMIFKRKSFHLFRDTQEISDSELTAIEEEYHTFRPLVDNIKTAIRIVPAKETSCKRGEEYCILLYSEKKDNYLQNIGYIGEQLDLYLATLNIGGLWYGIGKAEEVKQEGLDFVIMIAIAKVTKDQFRKDMFKCKRKPLMDIWNGIEYQDIGNIARFAPSACNTQPWMIDAEEKQLKVYRYKKPGKRGIMPVHKVIYYNRIDIGIFLLVMELCLKHNRIGYERTLFTDQSDDTAEKTLTAVYQLIAKE